MAQLLAKEFVPYGFRMLSIVAQLSEKRCYFILVQNSKTISQRDKIEM